MKKVQSALKIKSIKFNSIFKNQIRFSFRSFGINPVRPSFPTDSANIVAIL